jgi:hypothetical protein
VNERFPADAEVEQRLRDTLHDAADQIEPSPDALERIRERTQTPMTTRADVPAGARAELSAVPAGTTPDFVVQWKAALRLAAHIAALRRRTGRKAGSSRYRAGMARRPPPPDGDQAA